MTYVSHWTAVATLIKGLQHAGALYARFQNTDHEDTFGAADYLKRQCAEAIGAVETFGQTFEQTLPPEAKEAISRFLRSRPAAAARVPVAGLEEQGLRAGILALAALESQVTFVLSGRQEQIRARSERALLHLQRILAVDDDYRAKWMRAFERGEPACERLGSIHLLSHGIFAFKADAERGRTDLVFNEPPDETLLTRGVEGLVLTEWKVADDAQSVERGFMAARKQADLYRQGALAGVELTGYRYLVVVSKKEIPARSVPLDETNDAGVIYRHVNVVIEPTLPSIAARKARS